jgi:hypothetical protein
MPELEPVEDHIYRDRDGVIWTYHNGKFYKIVTELRRGLVEYDDEKFEASFVGEEN